MFVCMYVCRQEQGGLISGQDFLPLASADAVADLPSSSGTYIHTYTCRFGDSDSHTYFYLYCNIYRIIHCSEDS